MPPLNDACVLGVAGGLFGRAKYFCCLRRAMLAFMCVRTGGGDEPRCLPLRGYRQNNVAGGCAYTCARLGKHSRIAFVVSQT